jgi:putative endonuclease
MAWVYILRGSAGRYYIGSTENLERRLEEHRRGSNRTTRRFGSKVEIVITRTVSNAVEARRIEQALKRKKNPRLAIYALQQMP